MFISGVEDLCVKRDELHKQVLTEEKEKKKIQIDIRRLTERLAKINESLAEKATTRTEYDKTISRLEAEYTKVVKRNVQFVKDRGGVGGGGVLGFARLCSQKEHIMHTSSVSICPKLCQ